jgi:hypothetical protein
MPNDETQALATVWDSAAKDNRGTASRQYPSSLIRGGCCLHTQVREACSCTLLRGFAAQPALASCTKACDDIDSNPPKSGFKHENLNHLVSPPTGIASRACRTRVVGPTGVSTWGSTTQTMFNIGACCTCISCTLLCLGLIAWHRSESGKKKARPPFSRKTQCTLTDTRRRAAPDKTLSGVSPCSTADWQN